MLSVKIWIKIHCMTYDEFLLLMTTKCISFLLFITEIELCKEKQFLCGSGQCIDKTLVCDFNWDCQDGTDESMDTCCMYSSL